ncbi:MAG: DUF4430 domain-containing protein [Actinobacteria bacterium]|nr:DUF4430 domain-containing protein [Actinomycetota bacterium]
MLKNTASKAIIWAVILMMAGGGVLIGIRGCVFMPWNSAKEESSTNVSLAVTRDFGSKTIAELSVPFNNGDTVTDILAKSVHIETSYGGGFISSIEGLKSTMDTGGNDDWFYYVNGTLCDVGAREYMVKPGDRIWWDYHRWSEYNFVSSTTGAYPQPFAGNGVNSVANIVYSSSLESVARQVGQYLKEIGAHIVYRENPALFDRGSVDGPSMVFISTEEASTTGWIVDTLSSSREYGSFITLENGTLHALDQTGKPVILEEDISVAVQSLSSSIGDRSPVWLVLCKGDEGAKQAVRLLVTHPMELNQSFCAVAGPSGHVYKLPFREVN